MESQRTTAAPGLFGSSWRTSLLEKKKHPMEACMGKPLFFQNQFTPRPVNTIYLVTRTVLLLNFASNDRYIFDCITILKSKAASKYWILTADSFQAVLTVCFQVPKLPTLTVSSLESFHTYYCIMRPRHLAGRNPRVTGG